MKYLEVYEDLKLKINSAYYSSWSSLEGEEILCKKYGVSRPTLQKAINKLKQEGYVHSRQGSGVFINPPEFHSEQNLRTLSEKYGDKSIALKNEIIYFETVNADEMMASIFNLNVGDGLYHYKRLRFVDNIPLTVEETYMPVYLLKDFDKEELHGSVMRYIERNYNYSISHDIKTIKAIQTDAELSKLLNIKAKQPCLEITHTVFLTKSIPIQYTVEVLRDNKITIGSVR